MKILVHLFRNIKKKIFGRKELITNKDLKQKPIQKPQELKIIINHNHLGKKLYTVELEFRDDLDEFKYDTFNYVPTDSWPTRKSFKFIYLNQNQNT